MRSGHRGGAWHRHHSDVSFDGSGDWLRLVAGSTGSQSEAETTGSIPTTSTTTTTAPDPPSPDVGTSHYVDVDLDCQAFELGGIWTLVDVDTSTWHPPGERHEGGTFTIERLAEVASSGTPKLGGVGAPPVAPTRLFVAGAVQAARGHPASGP